MKNINWQGIYPAVTTQYNEDLPINFEATQKMIETIIKEGVDGIVALGTVGENSFQTCDEKVAMLKQLKRQKKISVVSLSLLVLHVCH